MHPFHPAAPAAAVLALAAPAAHAAFIIDVDYSGDPQFAQDFEDAADVWESKLSGYQSGLVVGASSASSYGVGDTVQTLFIDASVSPIDGRGGTLAQAGPSDIARDDLGFILATDGTMQFDSADIASLAGDGSFVDVILHEMAHVMGFGSLWVFNGVYENGTGEYMGENGNDAWQREYGQVLDPQSDVERDGGLATADGHWNEVDGGTAPTGIVVVDPDSPNFGRDLRDELMTGWLNDDLYISDMTIGSFVDIGFVAAIPEPAGAAALAGLLALAARRRRA